MLKKLLDNIAWQTIAGVVGFLSAAISLLAFFQEQTPEVRFEIMSSTNVLDFNADVSKLSVTYDSTDLKGARKNLRIFTIKMTNAGSEDLLKSGYDENDPLGLIVKSGQIIEKPEIIETSQEYLTKNLKIDNYGTNRFTYSEVILESKEFAITKILVLHATDSTPSVIPIGKIAGQKSISVVDAQTAKSEPSFLIKAFAGNILIQMARLVVYFIVVILVIVILVATSEGIRTRKEKRRKEMMVEQFEELDDYAHTKMDDAIFDRYEETDGTYLQTMMQLIGNENELNETYRRVTDKLKTKSGVIWTSATDRGHFTGESNKWKMIQEMISDGLVINDGNQLVVNQSMRETLTKFLAFIEQRGEFKHGRKVYVYPDLPNDFTPGN